MGPNLSFEAMALAPSRDRLVNEAAHRSVIHGAQIGLSVRFFLDQGTDLGFM